MGVSEVWVCEWAPEFASSIIATLLCTYCRLLVSQQMWTSSVNLLHTQVLQKETFILVLLR